MTDGTEAGTQRVAAVAPNAASSNPAEITAAGPWVFFRADDGETGEELWAFPRSDLPTDPDGDGIPTSTDNCLLEPNASQLDTDGDGYGNPGDASCPNGAQTDCNDGDPLVNPGAAEVCDDAKDNDCDGDIDCDDSECAGVSPCPPGGVGRTPGACVGGTASIANKVELMAPWLVLGVLITLIVSAVMLKRRRKLSSSDLKSGA